MRGFTLFEVVITLMITAILAGFITAFLTAPVDAYFDQSARTLLNDSSEVMSRRFAEDLRRALPNSVRIRNAGSRAIVELLRVESVGFYNRTGEVGVPARELDALAPDGTFSAYGWLDPAATANPYDLDDRYLVVGNAGTAGRNAYQLTNVIRLMGPADTVNRSGANEESVTLNPAFRFREAAVTNRVFVVTGPVAYICNAAANVRSLRRYENYAITAASPISEAAAQLNAAGVVNTLLADNITGCRMRCASGLATDNLCQGALTIEITTGRAVPGGTEAIRVFQQFPMDNNP